MIIFLYGPDTYSSRQKLREIIEEYKKSHPSGLNFIRINFSEKNLDDFRQAAETVSMFDEKKLIVIEGAFQQPEYFQEQLVDYLNKKRIDSDKDIVVVFWAEEIESKNKMFQFLKKNTKAQEFKLFQPHRLREWIKKYVKEQGGSIDNIAIEKLINYIGNDLWRMSNELDKLLNYSKSVEAGNIELLIKPEVDLNIFEMVDALGQRNRSKAIQLFNQHIKKGEDESYLFSMFIYQIRNLIKVKSGPMAKLDMHPFVIKKTSQQARNFSFEDLKKIYQKLLEIDLDVKTGKIDIKAALEMFIVGI